ncbi:uncharacterized protein LOC114358137 [Ostrinia furnacalis]|uniref:uncharacterized protein LOC114358137 n=1 Tax=Ostrinia furnacalis TaxID=93504 RepID=UPI00103D7FDF|nr:uncharacterized protein LOC114358137 [Ostrinia furnacalis]
MSQIFHKSCYTSRSSGYKYRTLSTNTGERKRRDSKEDSTFDRKFKELQKDISSRIENQIEHAQGARDHIREKFEKIDAKIDSMLELQNTVTSLRKNLHVVENSIAEMAQKIEKIDTLTMGSDACTLQSRKSSFRSQAPIFERDEVCERDDTTVSRT